MGYTMTDIQTRIEDGLHQPNGFAFGRPLCSCGRAFQDELDLELHFDAADVAATFGADPA